VIDGGESEVSGPLSVVSPNSFPCPFVLVCMTRYTRRATLRALAGGAVAGTLLGTASATTSTTTGEELWRDTSEARYEHGVTVVDGVVYAGKEGLAMSFDAESGEQLMRTSPGNRDISSTSAAAKLIDDTYYYRNGSTLAALDPADGSVTTQYTRDDSDVFDGFFDAAYADGEAYVVGAAGDETEGLAVAAIDVENGEERPLAEALAFDQQPAVVGDTVYVGGSNGDPVYLYAFDRESGEERWRVEGTDTFGLESAPAVVGDTVFAAGGSRVDEFGWIAALDIEDGSERWRTEVDGSPRIDPTVVDGAVYAGLRGGEFYALDAETGDVLWDYDAREARGTNLKNRGAPTVADGVVYVATGDGSVVGLDVESGEETWEADVDETIDTPPIVVDGVLYVTASTEPDAGTTKDGHVVAVDAAGDGSSEDSRVLQATYNHHDAWSADAAAYPDLLQAGSDDDGGDGDDGGSNDGGGDGGDGDGNSGGDGGSPGFGVGSALAALGGGAYAARRLRDGSRREE